MINANKNTIELYIHIPFCVKKCFYCDFLSFGLWLQTMRLMWISW